MSITLYGANLSPFVRKVRVALAYKGLDYELISVIPFGDDQPEEFKANSPLGKIPLLHIDGHWIADSSVILAYLERAYPQTPLLSDEPAVASRALWFEEYADSHMINSIGGHLFFELILAPIFFNREPNKEEIELAKTKEIPAIFDYLETQIQSDYLLGKTLAHADICLCSPFVNMHHCDVKCDEKKWPKTAAYIDRVMKSEFYTPILKEESKFLAMMRG